MTEAIVDAFHVVDIDEQHDHMTLLPLGNPRVLFADGDGFGVCSLRKASNGALSAGRATA
jgi:hypothetical protein